VVDLPSVPLLPDLPGPPDVYGVVGDPEVQTLGGRIPPTMQGLRALLLNDREARALTHAADAETAAAILADHGTTVVVTCGPVGAVAVEPGGRVTRAAAPRVEVEDTTGAGDLFTAAYVWADLSGRSIEERLDVAVRYASMSLAAAPPRGQTGLALEHFLEEV
jgi:sugar/nucleoside kinase (ribokinase family)